MALHVIVDPLSVPCAVPDTFRLFAHVALNDPFALVDVCSVTFHLKSVQLDGDGMIVADVQLPIRALTPGVLGAVAELERSNPTQAPAAMAAANTNANDTFRMVMVVGIPAGTESLRSAQYSRRQRSRAGIACRTPLR